MKYSKEASDTNKEHKPLLSYEFDHIVTPTEFNIIKDIALQNLKTMKRDKQEYWKNATFDTFSQELKVQRDARYYYDFLPKLDKLQKERSPRQLWEKEGEPKRKIDASLRPDSLISHASGHSFNSDVDIYPYKDGFDFFFKWRNNHVRMLPACKDYYYRDWERDGICVKNEDIFIKRAYAIITPESAKEGDFEETGMIDDDEGLDFEDVDSAAGWLQSEGVTEFSGCPPGTWYETPFISNPDDASEEQTSFHLYNINEKKEIELFKKVFPKDWKHYCPDI